MPGRNAGLPAHADGRLLAEPRNHPELPRGDRAPLLRPASERPHPALPDESRAGREGQRWAELSAGGKMLFCLLTSSGSAGSSTGFSANTLPCSGSSVSAGYQWVLEAVVWLSWCEG